MENHSDIYSQVQSTSLLYSFPSFASETEYTLRIYSETNASRARNVLLCVLHSTSTHQADPGFVQRLSDSITDDPCIDQLATL